MAYDTILADRMRPMLLPRAGMSEKHMFGGLGFLLYGNICCGIWKNMLIVRCEPQDADAFLTRPHVRPFDITGKPMRGWLLVEPEGLREDGLLLQWIERAVTHAAALPRKH